MKSCIFLVVAILVAVAAGQRRYRPLQTQRFVQPHASNEGAYHPGSDGSYRPDNSGAYRNDDGRYHPDTSGQYVHSDDKYKHQGEQYRHQDSKYQHQGEKYGTDGGVTGAHHGSGSAIGAIAGSALTHSHVKEAPLVEVVSTQQRFGTGNGFGSGFGSGTGSGVGNAAAHQQHIGHGSHVSSTPVDHYDNGHYRILKKEETVEQDGYHYLYETENGISAEEQGKLANVGTDQEGMRAHGFYTYTGPDNVVYTVRYTADENGFVPEGAHIPTPPPIPEAILRSLEYQRSLGKL